MHVGLGQEDCQSKGKVSSDMGVYKKGRRTPLAYESKYILNSVIQNISMSGKIKNRDPVAYGSANFLPQDEIPPRRD